MTPTDIGNELKRLVPQAVWHVVKSLEPHEKVAASIPFQQQVIDLLKSKRHHSFAFFGPAGTGKTSNSLWLYARAIIKALSTPTTGYAAMPLRASASATVRQHHAFVTADRDTEVARPTITASGTWCPIFLGELEKIGELTKYKYEVLFGIIDALYERRPKCQLVLDSNLTIDEFEAEFTDKISRRIAELCYRIDYFNETIIEPTEESMR